MKGRVRERSTGGSGGREWVGGASTGGIWWREWVGERSTAAWSGVGTRRGSARMCGGSGRRGGERWRRDRRAETRRRERRRPELRRAREGGSVDTTGFVARAGRGTIHGASWADRGMRLAVEERCRAFRGGPGGDRDGIDTRVSVAVPMFGWGSRAARVAGGDAVAEVRSSRGGASGTTLLLARLVAAAGFLVRCGGGD